MACPSIAPPTNRPRRGRCISRAALLVKVTREDLARPGLAGGDQMGEPGGQRGGLAGAGAGEHQHRSFGREHRFALRRVQALQIGGFGREGRGFRHACRGRRRRTDRQPSRRLAAMRRRFQWLFPISPLSTGFFPNFSLPRLGAEVHGAWVIGTAVPASPRAGNGRRARQVTKGPISAGRQWEELSGSFRGQPGRGAGRGDLPLARRGSSEFFGASVSKAGRKRGYPKKGRGTSDGFGREFGFRTWFGIEFQWTGRTRKTSEPSGSAVR